jgi:hypothetical protein
MIVYFDRINHTYTDNAGKQYPSVTQVLKAGGVYNLDFLPAATRDKALELGTRIHRVLELDDLGALNARKVSKQMRGYLKAWRAWKKASGFIVFDVERPFISAYGYAGTVDRSGAFKNNHTPVILDLKTGAHIPEWCSIQTCAYGRGIWQVCKHFRRIAFMPFPDGTYTVKEFPVETLTTDFAKFMQALRKMKEEQC